MSRPIILCTLQWSDLPLEEVCRKAKESGYDGLELAIPAHLDVRQTNPAYYKGIKDLLEKYGLSVYAISSHLISQAICDNINIQHKIILPDYIWKDGDFEGVRQRAIESLIQTAQAAKALNVNTVAGFTGSSIWHLVYSYPMVSEEMIDEGFQDFARRFRPILDEYQRLGIRYALEVHPTEIAFDTFTAQRALHALDNHPAFGFNYDPSHLAYQAVDYIDFIHTFPKRIFHVHAKDVCWRDKPEQIGFFCGYLPFDDPRRYWYPRGLGRGKVRFKEIMKALDDIDYKGPLSIECEDNGLNREEIAIESCRFLKGITSELK